MDLNNRYLRLSLLGLFLAILIYLLIWTIFKVIDLEGFPVFLHLTVSVLGAGYLVYQFFYDRIQ